MSPKCRCDVDLMLAIGLCVAGLVMLTAPIARIILILASVFPGFRIMLGGYADDTSRNTAVLT